MLSGRGVRTGVALVVAGLALAGCGEDAADTAAPGRDGGRAEAPATVPPSAGGVAQGVAVGSERPADPAAAAVYDAYVGYWRANVAALRNPALAGPALDLAADPQRSRTEKQLRRLARDEERSAGDLRISPSAITVGPAKASLRDCLDRSGMTLRDAEGGEVPGSAGEAQQVAVSLVRAPGAWLVSDVKVRSGSC